MTNFGIKLMFGVEPPLPLRGFPEGRARIRQRANAHTIVYIRPPEGGIRQFYVRSRDGAWWPAFERGANRNNLPSVSVGPVPSEALLVELQNELHRVSTAHVQTQFILGYISAYGETSGWPRVRQVIDKVLKGQDMNDVLREAAKLVANTGLDRQEEAK
jgi:hypothetical protein